MDAMEILSTKYNVSLKNGFLPDSEPLDRLPEPFSHWEKTLDKLIELIKRNKVLQDVDKWPYVEPNDDFLPSELHWQRAYLVLTFVAHAILGAADAPSELPRVLAVPWSKVSSHLQLPTVTCYAAVVLYNWRLIDPEKGTTPGNLKILHSYTGTRDEEWFYLVSMFCELAAAPGIVAVVEAFSAAKSRNIPQLIECLSRVASAIENIKTTAMRMYEECKPDVFYTQVRPFQSGYEGIVFEGVTAEQPQKVSGASAAQSSTIPVFDILLGVKTDEFEKTNKFLKEQRDHMPVTHRDFLTELARKTSVRGYVANCGDAELMRCFNDCVKKLVKFRKCHHKLTTKMIVEPAGKCKDGAGTGGNIVGPATDLKGEAVKKKDEQHIGTGGTDFRVMLNEIITATEKAEL